MKWKKQHPKKKRTERKCEKNSAYLTILYNEYTKATYCIHYIKYSRKDKATFFQKLFSKCKSFWTFYFSNSWTQTITSWWKKYCFRFWIIIVIIYFFIFLNQVCWWKKKRKKKEKNTTLNNLIYYHESKWGPAGRKYKGQLIPKNNMMGEKKKTYVKLRSVTIILHLV